MKFISIYKIFDLPASINYMYVALKIEFRFFNLFDGELYTFYRGKTCFGGSSHMKQSAKSFKNIFFVKIICFCYLVLSLSSELRKLNISNFLFCFNNMFKTRSIDFFGSNLHQTSTRLSN